MSADRKGNERHELLEFYVAEDGDRYRLVSDGHHRAIEWDSPVGWKVDVPFDPTSPEETVFAVYDAMAAELVAVKAERDEAITIAALAYSQLAMKQLDDLKARIAAREREIG